ncbi:phage tail protein [Dyella sp. ASV21]|uniref:phage tail protein n=1 Tax=Dyella sp. ASV21 TaxID=2795114 RepID=UPI0018EB7B8B|nr:phage tail protein [Dyella sp. ASV21]
MNKPARLRAAIMAALPDLATNPERLSIFVEKGRLIATGVPGGGWDYAYTATVLIQDFAGDMDDLAGAVIAWLHVEQPDLLLSADERERAIRFQCDLMDNEQADIALEIDLTEAVRANAAGGGYVHPPAPPSDPTADWL